MKAILFRVDEDLYKLIEERAKEEHRSRANLVKSLVIEGLENEQNT